MPAVRLRALAAPALLALAACAEFPTGNRPDPPVDFPAAYRVEVRTDEARRHFVARVENPGPLGLPNVTFTVTLVDQLLQPPVGTGAAASGLIAAGAAEELTVSFDRSLAYRCYGWKLATADGRKVGWDNCR